MTPLHYVAPIKGEVVRFVREALGWYQTELADRFGVHVATLKRWEGKTAEDPNPAYVRLALFTLVWLELPRSTAGRRRKLLDALDALYPEQDGTGTQDAT